MTFETPSAASPTARRKQSWAKPLVLWMLMGLALRLLNLSGKPVWADEWTTFVFSLGHSFRDLPLNQLLSLDRFLQVVRLDDATAAAGVQHLMAESTHPPLYFWLSHYWIQLWQQAGEVVSPWVGRSLSVCFGVLTIPAVYGVALWGGTSRRAALLAAALMAVSPYGVYLAQDARHYTLAMLWGIVSLGCFVRAWQAVSVDEERSERQEFSDHQEVSDREERLPWHTVWGWIGINALGFATHYVFALLLAAQGLAFGGRWLWLLGQKLRGGVSVRLALASLWARPWRRVALAAIGSGVGLLPWAWFLGRASGDEITAWIEQELSGWALLEPLGRLFTWLLSMVMLLPIEQVPTGVVIVSVLLLLAGLVWLLPQLVRGGRFVLRDGALDPGPPENKAITERSVLQALLAIALSQVAVLLLLAYGFQRDLTLSPRYVFALLPQVAWVVAIAVNALGARGRRVATVLLLLGCLGSGTVAFDFAYQKADRPDLMVQKIETYYREWQAKAGEAWPQDPLSVAAPRSLVISIIQKTHSETGKLLGVAQEWEKQGPEGLREPDFILLRRNPYTYAATRGIREATATVARPFDLWILNFSANANFRDLGCSLEYTVKLRSPGYSARRFVCR